MLTLRGGDGSVGGRLLYQRSTVRGRWEGDGDGGDSQESKLIARPLGTFQKGCMGPLPLRRFHQCWESDAVQLPISTPHWALTLHVWLASPGLQSFHESGLLAPGCSPYAGPGKVMEGDNDHSQLRC